MSGSRASGHARHPHEFGVDDDGNGDRGDRAAMAALIMTMTTTRTCDYYVDFMFFL